MLHVLDFLLLIELRIKKNGILNTLETGPGAENIVYSNDLNILRFLFDSSSKYFTALTFITEELTIGLD